MRISPFRTPEIAFPRFTPAYFRHLEYQWAHYDEYMRSKIGLDQKGALRWHKHEEESDYDLAEVMARQSREKAAGTTAQNSKVETEDEAETDEEPPTFDHLPQQYDLAKSCTCKHINGDEVQITIQPAVARRWHSGGCGKKIGDEMTIQQSTTTAASAATYGRVYDTFTLESPMRCVEDSDQILRDVSETGATSVDDARTDTQYGDQIELDDELDTSM